jgi:hypothetical protein
MSSDFPKERGLVAALTRFRDPADPELLDARRRMQEEALVASLAVAVAKAPPITTALRQRLLDLLPVADRGIN